jgi:hypothetical protein
MTHNLVFKRKIMPQADNMAQNEKRAWREDGQSGETAAMQLCFVI